MKESSFIKKNLKSWREYEEAISNKHEKATKFSKIFIKISDDLSYSYTYYKNRSVRVYLNGIAKSLFNKINRSERFRPSYLKKFFTKSVPLSIYQSRNEFLLSFIIFTIAIFIGVLSSKYDPEFAQLILGDNYIKMTEANIAQNDPMAVYKSQAPFDMFFGITLNNFRIAVKTFALGIFLAVGTIFTLLYNGIMVGVFQYFFLEQGIYKESLLTIWQHGVLEISSIILAGAAGLVLGKGLLFPGNYSRFQSLRISSRKGLKLLLGLLPILLIAAFIEGFFTRFTNAPDIIRVISILTSLSFIIGYFIILPRYRGKQITSNAHIESKIELSRTEEIDLTQIYKESELFILTFQVLKNNLKTILISVLITAMIIPFYLFILRLFNLHDTSIFNHQFNPITDVFANKYGIFILIISFSVLFFTISKPLANSPAIKAQKRLGPFAYFIQLALILAFGHLVLFIPNHFWAIFLFVLLLILSTLIINILKHEQVSVIHAISKSFRYLNQSVFKLLFLSVRILVLGALFYLAFYLIIPHFNEFLQMNLAGSKETINSIIYYIGCYYFCVVILFIASFIFLGNHILFFSLHEQYHAKNLLSKIEQIGNTKRIRGLLRG